MTTKTKKSNKSVARSPRTRDERATNAQRVVHEPQTIRYAYAPILQQFRAHTKKNEARLWIPIETNLVSRYEFAACSLPTRYIFVAILLYCAGNGIDEIPLDAKFMSSVLVADFRTIEKSFVELLSKNLLQERKERIERIEQTDRQDTLEAAVSVSDLNLFEIKEQSQNGLLKKELALVQTNGNKQSMYSIEECLKYVEFCQTKGEKIQSPKALANHLSKSGEADSFIMQTLYPKDAEAIALETFGEPFEFINEPCTVCFGAKMADVDGKGFRACVNCINERGQATGKEPEGKINNE